MTAGGRVNWRQLDAIDLTECAGDAAQSTADTGGIVRTPGGDVGRRIVPIRHPIAPRQPSSA